MIETLEVQGEVQSDVRNPHAMTVGAPNGSVAVGAQAGRQLPTVPTDANGNISPSQLILAALDRGVSVDALEKLTALQERFEDRQALRDFTAAMAAFQNECPMIAKTKTAKIATQSGGEYSYTFAPLEVIVATIMPYVKRHGFTYSWNQEETKDGRARTTIRVRHVGGHVEESHFTLPTDSKSAMSSQQKQAAANTFAKRQTLIAAFGLTTADEDFDGMTGGGDTSDPTLIDEDQATHISDTIVESKANVQKFFKHFGISSVAELPAKRYQEALLMLKQVAAERNRRGGAQ